MNFTSEEDTARAMTATARWLPVLIQSLEASVADLGLTILERSRHTDEDGTVCPILVARGRRLTFRLELRNALEDFLTLDRDARPVRVDPRLGDEDYAESKLADVVAERLEIVSILDGCDDLDDARQRIGDLAERFAWVRAVAMEDATAANDGGTRRPPEPPKPVCELFGQDGNVFAIIGRVREALRRAGQTERATEFVQRAMGAGSYDQVLQLCME